jgi:hypothetical protein
MLASNIRNLYLPHTERKIRAKREAVIITVSGNGTFGKDTVKRALFFTDFVPWLIAANELNLCYINNTSAVLEFVREDRWYI